MDEDNDEEPDSELLLRYSNMLQLVAKTKQELAKYAYQDKRIQALEEFINSKKLTKFSQEYDKDALPG